MSFSSHIGIASSLPTTAYVKMIDVFMIFTMTIPLLEIIGHTYAESLRSEISGLDEISDHRRHSLASPGSVSVLPLGIDHSKLDLPQIKSKLFANDKRLVDYHGLRLRQRVNKCFQNTFGEEIAAMCLLPGCAYSYCGNRYIKLFDFHCRIFIRNT